MEDSHFDENFFSYPSDASHMSEHLRDEQSCQEQHDIDVIYNMFGISGNEQRVLLMDILTGISSDIVREHIVRVQAEVSELERLFAL